MRIGKLKLIYICAIAILSAAMWAGCTGKKAIGEYVYEERIKAENGYWDGNPRVYHADKKCDAIKENSMGPTSVNYNTLVSLLHKGDVGYYISVNGFNTSVGFCSECVGEEDMRRIGGEIETASNGVKLTKLEKLYKLLESKGEVLPEFSKFQEELLTRGYEFRREFYDTYADMGLGDTYAEFENTYFRELPVRKALVKLYEDLKNAGVAKKSLSNFLAKTNSEDFRRELYESTKKMGMVKSATYEDFCRDYFRNTTVPVLKVSKLQGLYDKLKSAGEIVPDYERFKKNLTTGGYEFRKRFYDTYADTGLMGSSYEEFANTYFGDNDGI